MSDYMRQYEWRGDRLYTEDGWEVQVRQVKSVKKLDDGTLDVSTYDDPRYFGNGFVIPAERVKGELIPGDRITLYSAGNFIRGYKVNHNEWYYQTKEQAETERKEYLAKMKADKEREFEENIDEWQQSMVGLRPPFYRRLVRFEHSQGFKEFWTNSGPYELFIYLEANKLISAVLAVHPHDMVSQVAWLEEFKAADMDKQKEMFPDVSNDHSGFTHSAMIAFAFAYIEGTLE